LKNQKANIPEFDNFISDVRPNASQVEKLSMINGYIGESSLDEHFRVYFDDELNNFIEIPNDSVLKCEKRPKESFPLGGSYIWVKSDSIFTYGNPQHYNRPKSTFLEGKLWNSYFDNRKNKNYYNQPEVTEDCPNASDECPDTSLYCPSKVVCPSEICNQNFNASRVGFCPSHLDACPSSLGRCNNNQNITDLRISRLRACPSWVDGCGPIDFGYRGKFNPYQR